MRLFIVVIFILISTTMCSYADEAEIEQKTDISKPVASETKGINAYVIGFVSGMLSGVISPLVLSLLKHKVIWKSQKKHEIKYSIFNDAVRAVSLYATDALDPKLQSDKTSYKGQVRKIELRPETSELLEKSRGLVQAFFTPETYAAFSAVLKEKISIEEIPCTEFEEKRTIAILKLSEELGIK